MSFQKPKRYVYTLLLGTALLGTVYSQASQSASNRNDLIEAVQNLVAAEYVEPVDQQKLVEGALKGMLEALDPHSSYMNEEDFRAFQSNTRGSFGGIGIEIGERDEALTVIAPIADTPAARAGLEAGDKIVHINGKPTKDVSVSDAVGKLRGDIGSSVRIGIQRAGGKPFDVTLTRAVIEVDPVKSRVERGVGYIKLGVFSERAAQGVQEAIHKIRQETGDKVKGYVLDLRNDPGGLLDQAISVADLFLEEGEVVSVRGRHPGEERRYRAESGDITGGAPLVVLINGGSASASEIVAGALQDHHRATIIGTQSFGKGSVQNIIPLNGYGAVRLTTARYYTPSGRSIQLVGVTPDMVVEGDKSLEPMRHEADLEGALSNPTMTTVPSVGEQATDTSRKTETAASVASAASKPTEAGAKEDQPDLQLDKAIEVLSKQGGIREASNRAAMAR